MLKDEVGGIAGLNKPLFIIVSPSGDRVYATAAESSSLIAFDRYSASGALVQIQIRQHLTYMYDPVGIAASPDGRHIYVTDAVADSVTAFQSDLSRSLILRGEIADGEFADGLEGARSAVVSADGENIYVAGCDENSVAILGRNSDTGIPFYLAKATDGLGGVDGLAGVQDLTLSPDDRHLYAASQTDNAVAVFSRDLVSGALAFVEMEKDGVNSVDGLAGAYAVVVSSDGKHVYVTGYNDNAVAYFSRDSLNGSLTYLGNRKDGVGGVNTLAGANDLVLSPLGDYLYVASRTDDSVTAFSRNSTTGGLSMIGSLRDGVGGVDGLDGARGIAIRPDGRTLYLASQLDDAVVVFRIDATGVPHFSEVHKDGVDGVDGLDTADGIAVSPSGANIYVSGYDDHALATFRDGLETFLPLVIR
jgi:6-phosphogluconolactonase (cycloisomerase 2 family)